MDDSDTEPNIVPESIHETAKTVELSMLSESTKLRYTATYNKFNEWQNEQGSSSFDEDVLLAYFSQMDCAPPTLTARFSMIRTCALAYNNIDISKYPKINQYLKKKNAGYKCKRSKVFTTNDITRFCNECTDPDWLVLKVVCIFGTTGACQREQLTAMKLNEVEDHQTMLLVKISKTKTKIPRLFTVVGEFYEICKQYLNIRNQQKGNTRFFNKMLNGKCENKPIGINTIGSMPKRIAEFLKLPEPQLYTGHCFRRTSIALLVADGRGDITTRKRNSDHKSTEIVDSYIENSIQNKDPPSTSVVHMDDEKLIAEMEKYPELYDPANKNFAKQHWRHNCWVKIAVQMKSTVKDVKKRWLALRAMHWRAIKTKNETSSGQDATSSKKWRFEDQMSFLKLFVTEETIPNFDERSQNSEESVDKPNEAEAEAPMQIESEDSSCLLSTSYGSSTPSTSKRRKRPLLKSKPKQHKDSVFQNYLDKQQKLEKKSELEDPLIHFFISMGKIVKNFTPYQQAIVKGRVYQIINEIELNSNVGSSQAENLNYHNIPPFPGQNYNY